MVRVGGGWSALEEFLSKNDPCRGKKHDFFKLSTEQNLRKETVDKSKYVISFRTR